MNRDLGSDVFFILWDCGEKIKIDIGACVCEFCWVTWTWLNFGFVAGLDAALLRNVNFP